MSVGRRMRRSVASYVHRYGEPCTVRRVEEAEGYQAEAPEPVKVAEGNAVSQQMTRALKDQATIRDGDRRIIMTTGGEWEPRSESDRIELADGSYRVVDANAHRISGATVAWEIHGRA